MKIYVVYILCVIVFLTSCEKKATITPVDHKALLIQALKNNNGKSVKDHLTNLKLTENSQNIINVYMQLFSENLLTLNNSLNYLGQFYSNMTPVHQMMYERMTKWVYLKEIYRQEISPPVRILQRKELLLAPSNIDFTVCNSQAVKLKCAYKQRSILLAHMTEDEINSKLKAMALKDPCVNLSFNPQGQKIANRCLMKSTGDLKIELLPVPSFTSTQWLQALNE